MNTETCVNMAKAFNDAAKEQEVEKTFVMISAEKPPPFLDGYTETKREAEKYLLDECDNLRVHILRPGFIVDPTERNWSQPLACAVTFGYNLNQQIVQKTPLGSTLDFLFPAQPIPLVKLAEVATEAAQNKLPPQIWSNDMLINFEREASH